MRTRFAPSPTGYMHIGNLRTALYNYLITKHYNGEFILRIEDTDQNREVLGAKDIIYNVLKETGLNWDEGPDKEGLVGPYIQSKRLDIYKEYALKLISYKGAHYCFCKHLDEGCKDPCSNLTSIEIKERLSRGDSYVIRQSIVSDQELYFDDEVYGHIEFNSNDLDEGILLKSDGYPTYNFANVIDDHLMGITHVIRGNEYLISTPKYNLIYDAFNWDRPTYIHLPPVMKDEKHKLSKRNGDASYQDLIEQGYLKEVIINYIALLGCSFGDKEVMSLDELIEYFDVKHISKAPAIFDINKLKWLNGVYLRNMSLEDYHKLVMPYYKHITRNIDYLELSKVLQPRIERLIDIEEMTDFINEPLEFDINLYTHKKMKTNPSKSLNTLRLILPILEEYNNYNDDESFFNMLTNFCKENKLKNGQLLWPIRVALTNKSFSPGGAIEAMHILGKEESIKRIKKAINDLNNNL